MQATNAKRYGYVEYDKLDLTNGIYVFSDGSTFNNGQKDKNLPCVGGWGTVIIEDGEEIYRASGGEENTSISRMELLGVINGLEALLKLKGACETVVVSDSQYVIRGCCEYLRGWLKRGWKNNQGVDTANQDLWKRLVKLSNASGVLSYGSELSVMWSWVRGHVGHVWNEECDVLASNEKNKLVEGLR